MKGEIFAKISCGELIREPAVSCYKLREFFIFHFVSTIEIELLTVCKT